MTFSPPTSQLGKALPATGSVVVAWWPGKGIPFRYQNRATRMAKPDRSSLFFEVADIISLVEYRYASPAAKKLRQATKLLVEAGSLISQLPDVSDRRTTSA